MQHLNQHFHKDEPIRKLAQLPENDNYPEFSNSRIAWKLDSCRDTCILSVHEPTKRIVGLQFCFKWTKEEAEEDSRAPPVSAQTPNVPAFRKIHELCSAPLQANTLGIFNKYNVPHVAYNWLVSTSSEYRGQGLASEMFRRMTLLLKSKNYPLVFGGYSSPYSRRCAEKLGFVEEGRTQLGDVRNEFGEIVLPLATNEDLVSLMVLRL